MSIRRYLLKRSSVVLRSNLFMVTAIKKPTKAVFWRDLQVGDYIRFVYRIADPGRGNGLYASTIAVWCGDKKVANSPTMITQRLANFELEEIIPLATDCSK